MYRLYAAAVPSIPVPQPHARGPPSGCGMPMICMVSSRSTCQLVSTKQRRSVSPNGSTHPSSDTDARPGQTSLQPRIDAESATAGKNNRREGKSGLISSRPLSSMLPASPCDITGEGGDSLVWIDEGVVNQVSVDVHGHLADVPVYDAGGVVFQSLGVCWDSAWTALWGFIGISYQY